VQSTYVGKAVGSERVGLLQPVVDTDGARLKLSKISTAPVIDSTPYRCIIGGLRYLVCAQPNIALSFAISADSWSSLMSITLMHASAPRKDVLAWARLPVR
jgi:hypothetical protein